MVAIPLFYPAAVFPTAWYERYRLHRRPYKYLAVHLAMVCTSCPRCCRSRAADSLGPAVSSRGRRCLRSPRAVIAE